MLYVRLSPEPSAMHEEVKIPLIENHAVATYRDSLDIVVVSGNLIHISRTNYSLICMSFF